jgi:hypothetical protein
MEKLTVDSPLLSTLNKVDHEVELCDPTGRTVGYFVPAADAAHEIYARARGQFTDEELERAAKEPGGKSTAEVLARLLRT